MPLFVPPAIHAAQHERAGHAVVRARGRLYRWQDRRQASGYGHLTRSRPQDSASNAAAPQWEPRKPLAGRASSRPLWPDVRFGPYFVCLYEALAVKVVLVCVA